MEADPRARLAVRPAEAAKLLGISPRFLSTLTSTGRIPCVRLGRKCVVYRPVDLDRWLAEQTKGEVVNG